MSQAGKYFISGGGTGFVSTLTGNTGGAVGPDGADNINVLGGHDINTVGNPGTHTITVNLNNAITLGDLTPIAAGSDAITAVTGNITIQSGNFKLPTTTALVGQIIVNGTPFIHSYGTQSTFIGSSGLQAGNFTLTGQANCMIGGLSGSILSSGLNNSSLGQGSLEEITSGNGNCSFGFESSQFISSGSDNCSFGALSLNILLTGSDNIAIGSEAGDMYDGAESSNIVIGNSGTTGESHVIRIGTQGVGSGEQDACYIAGISGANVGSVATVVSIATGSGNLGTTTITAGTGITITPGANTITIAATGTSNFNYTNVATTPYVVLATDEYLSVDSSAMAITVNLPNAPAIGRAYIIKDRTGSAAAHNITVTTVGGVVDIDGATTFVMNTNFEAIQVLFNGTSYEIF